jgi:hypothetical protein
MIAFHHPRLASKKATTQHMVDSLASMFDVGF